MKLLIVFIGLNLASLAYSKGILYSGGEPGHAQVRLVSMNAQKSLIFPTTPEGKEYLKSFDGYDNKGFYRKINEQCAGAIYVSLVKDEEYSVDHIDYEKVSIGFEVGLPLEVGYSQFPDSYKKLRQECINLIAKEILDQQKSLPVKNLKDNEHVD